MKPARQLAPVETEPLLWAEICVRYPDQFVCLIDVEPVEVRSPEIRSARVVGHGPTHGAAFDPIRGLGAQYPGSWVRFTGVATKPLRRPTPVIDDEIIKFLRF
jgi:hypothetical protein